MICCTRVTIHSDPCKQLLHSTLTFAQLPTPASKVAGQVLRGLSRCRKSSSATCLQQLSELFVQIRKSPQDQCLAGFESWCPGETRSLRYGAPICWGEDVWFIGDAPKSAPKTRTTLPPRSLWVRVPVARRYARSSARPAGGGELHSSALPWRGPQTQQPAPQPCGRSVPARTLRCGAVGFRPLISNLKNRFLILTVRKFGSPRRSGSEIAQAFDPPSPFVLAGRAGALTEKVAARPHSPGSEQSWAPNHLAPSFTLST